MCCGDQFETRRQKPVLRGKNTTHRLLKLPAAWRLVDQLTGPQ